LEPRDVVTVVPVELGEVCPPQLRVDVHLRHAGADRRREFGVGQARGAVQDERDAGARRDRAHAVEVHVDGRGREAVDGPDRRSERVDAGALDEVGGQVGVGQLAGDGARGRVLVARHPADLRFHPDPCLVRLGDDRARERHVVLERQVRSVEHHRRVAQLEAGADLVEVGGVVQVDADRDARLAGGCDGRGGEHRP
jgi:hypothetical protein